MRVRGKKQAVDIWYICWGELDASYNAELYATWFGVRRWLTGKAMRDVPIHRIGWIVITEEGPIEKDHWSSREEFLKAPS